MYQCFKNILQQNSFSSLTGLNESDSKSSTLLNSFDVLLPTSDPSGITVKNISQSKNFFSRWLNVKKTNFIWHSKKEFWWKIDSTFFFFYFINGKSPTEFVSFPSVFFLFFFFLTGQKKSRNLSSKKAIRLFHQRVSYLQKNLFLHTMASFF